MDKKDTEGVKGDWMPMPAFGDWDMQKGVPDYSLDFSKIREMRKQNKSDYSHISIGNEDDILHGSNKQNNDLHRRSKTDDSLSGSSATPAIPREHPTSGRKKRMSYLICCIWS